MWLMGQIATPPNGEATIEIPVYGADLNPIAREYPDLLGKIKEKKDYPRIQKPEAGWHRVYLHLTRVKKSFKRVDNGFKIMYH